MPLVFLCLLSNIVAKIGRSTGRGLNDRRHVSSSQHNQTLHTHKKSTILCLSYLYYRVIMKIKALGIFCKGTVEVSPYSKTVTTA